MDPELKAALDTIVREMAAMRQENTERFATVEGRMATKDDLDVLRAEIRSGDEETRRHMDVLHEATQRRLQAAEEGRQAMLEHIDRRFEGYHRELRARHIDPLEASAANHERRIAALEERSR